MSVLCLTWVFLGGIGRINTVAGFPIISGGMEIQYKWGLSELSQFPSDPSEIDSSNTNVVFRLSSDQARDSDRNEGLYDFPEFPQNYYAEIEETSIPISLLIGASLLLLFIGIILGATLMEVCRGICTGLKWKSFTEIVLVVTTDSKNSNYCDIKTSSTIPHQGYTYCYLCSNRGAGYQNPIEDLTNSYVQNRK